MLKTVPSSMAEYFYMQHYKIVETKHGYTFHQPDGHKTVSIGDNPDLDINEMLTRSGYTSVGRLLSTRHQQGL